jgi:hypothetical protein
MPTVMSAGASALADGKAAVATATKKAVEGLGGSKPAFGFLFASPDVDLGAALASVRAATGAQIIGCSTAGQFTDKNPLAHTGVAIGLVSSDLTTKVGFASGLRERPEVVAGELAGDLSETRRQAATRDHRHLTTMLLTDGLAGTGEKLLNHLYEGRVQSGTQFVGGAAGDEGRFVATHVGAGDMASPDSAAAMHVFGARPWGVGVGHGLKPTGKPMRVTKAEGNVVFEIGGEPAFAVYKRHAEARGFMLTPENAGPYLIENEIGIHFFEKVSRARAPLSVGPDGSLSCAAEIPKGSMVSILQGEPDSMVRAASSAARDAYDRLAGAKPAGVVLFDCVCRGMILKDRFERELDAVRTVFPGAPIVGFLTYGEIARSNELLAGWHNTTAVVVAIPA